MDHVLTPSAWLWTVRYWLVVAATLVLLPLWVLYSNVEDGLTESERFGLIASSVPAVLGVGLGSALLWLQTNARTRTDLAGEVGHQLGVGLGGLSLLAAVGSLATMDGRFFLAALFLLLLPAGLLAGASADLRSRKR